MKTIAYIKTGYGKHSLFILVLLSFLVGSSSASAQKKNDIEEGTRYLDTHFALYDSIQKQIHSLAELGYLEYKSSALLIDHLERNGFQIEKGVAGIPTAFIATYGESGPAIGLMAEYDALPGMSQDTVPYKKAREGSADGHACGHNLLGTGAVAGAVAISKWIAKGHPGTVKLYGCPAEEGGGAKAYLVRDGCFDGVDAVLDWHPASDNSVAVETGLANVQIDFRFHGVASHAAMSPEKGRSALDAVEAFDMMMNLMREHVPMTTRIHYVITNGGQAPNVVPDYAEVEYYIRSPKRTIVEDVKARALQAAQGAAMGTGTTMTYEIKSGNYERLYNHTLAEVLQQKLEQVGGVCYDSRESAFVSRVLEESGVKDTLAAFAQVREVAPLQPEAETLTGASSDVGNVSWVVPVGSFGVAAFAPGGYGHCWQQTASGGTTIGTKGLLNAAKVMYLTACELLARPKLIDQAKEEFESRRGEDFKFEPLMGDRTPPLDYRVRNK
ncbi:MAG: amidohydrolase [Prevotellaceae bacterium]|nr:amidohydrolase [Prevotellaceae bacterium]